VPFHLRRFACAHAVNARARQAPVRLQGPAEDQRGAEPRRANHVQQEGAREVSKPLCCSVFLPLCSDIFCLLCLGAGSSAVPPRRLTTYLATPTSLARSSPSARANTAKRTCESCFLNCAITLSL